jgi:acyl-CoA thioester hydrolase
MPYEFIFSRRVEFAETDMAGIVHFANFYRMMENAEHAFFRSLGFSVHDHFDGQTIGWPRVSATCDFLRPLRFEEMVDVHLFVAEVRIRSLRYAFKLSAVPIPAKIRESLEPAPAELLAVFSPVKQN